MARRISHIALAVLGSLALPVCTATALTHTIPLTADALTAFAEAIALALFVGIAAHVAFRTEADQ